MDDILIYLEGEENPYTIGKLTDKIISEGTEKVSASFSEFQKMHEFQLSLPHMDKEARIQYAKAAIQELRPTYQNSIPKTHEQLKAQLPSFLMPILVQENNKNVLYRTRYDLQINAIASEIMFPKKLKYFSEVLDREDLNFKNQNFGKIKWLKGVSEFGFMILRLEEKGYIELPIGSNPEGAYQKLAKILFETFDVTESWLSFKDALNHNRNKLSEIKRIKLENFPEEFPDAQQLGNPRKRKRKE